LDDEINRNDEITIYYKAKVLCSMEAMFQVLGFHTYPKPEPAVKEIKVKTPNQVNYIQFVEKKTCAINQYFNRPASLKNLKFTEFFNQYIINKQLPAR
jgi:hypothetical protein